MRHTLRLAIAVLGLSLLAASAAFAEGNDTPFSWKVGTMEVIQLVDAEGEINTDILLGASPGQIERYVPKGTGSSVNAFLLRTPGRVMLVDAGFGQRIFGELESLGIAPEAVNAVLLTHMHVDHISGLLRDGKPAFPNAQIFVSEAEKAYWTDTAIMAGKPEPEQKAFKLPQAVVAAYEGRISAFAPGTLKKPAPLFPGIKSIAAYGHTLGHSMFLLESEGNKLLIWGDLTHVTNLQAAVPTVAVTYDIDPAQAVETRKEVLAHVAANNIPVAGMHVSRPAMGRIKAVGEGSYSFTPLGE